MNKEQAKAHAVGIITDPKLNPAVNSKFYLPLTVS
jgi:hypothetical protein